METQAAVRGEDETVIVHGHVRRKHGRNNQLDALPRIEVIHELDDNERACPHDSKTLTEIGEVTSEQIDIIPATIRVIHHIPGSMPAPAAGAS